MLRKLIAVTSVVVLSLNLTAQASHTYPNPMNGMTGPISYVDATHSNYNGLGGNTQLAVGAALQGNIADPSVPGPTLTHANATDNIWRLSPNGNLGFDYPATGVAQSVYESNGSITSSFAAGEDSWRLLTTVPVALPPGTPLHVYVYFWTDATSWRIQAGLKNTSGGPLPLYAANDGAGAFKPGTPQTANLGPFPGDNVNPFAYFANQPFGNPVVTAQTGLSLMEGYLGVGFVNGGGNVEVYVDDVDISTAPGFGTQAGRNFRTWYDGIGVVEATAGSSQQTPIVAPAVGPNGMTFAAAPRRRWFDPPLVDRYDFSIEPGSLFTLAGLPLGFNNSFGVYVGNSLLGTFAGGDEVDFVSLLGSGVSSFSVRGISPLVDAQNTQAFPIFLDFNTETATFTMTPVPEPCLLGLSALGLCGFVTIRRKRARS